MVGWLHWLYVELELSRVYWQGSGIYFFPPQFLIFYRRDIFPDSIQTCELVSELDHFTVLEINENFMLWHLWFPSQTSRKVCYERVCSKGYRIHRLVHYVRLKTPENYFPISKIECCNNYQFSPWLFYIRWHVAVVIFAGLWLIIYKIVHKLLPKKNHKFIILFWKFIKH